MSGLIESCAARQAEDAPLLERRDRPWRSPYNAEQTWHAQTATERIYLEEPKT